MLRKIKYVTVDFISAFVSKKVMRSAAALSYYLMLTFFPFLICFNWIIGLVDINFSLISQNLSGIIPASAFEIMEGYMEYVYSNQSAALLIAGGVMFITGLSAAFRLLFVTLEDINGVKRIKGLKFYISGIISSTVFLFGTYIFLMIAMFSGIIIDLINSYFVRYIRIDLHIFEILPYWLLLAYLFIVLTVLYKKSHHKGYPVKRVWKGALVGAVGVIFVSRMFSVFIEFSTRYSLVYGSLSSVILLMVWLFVCSNVIICGNILNYGINRLSER